MFSRSRLFQPRVAQVSLFEIIFAEDLSHMKKPDNLRSRSALLKEAGRPPAGANLPRSVNSTIAIAFATQPAQ